MPKLKTRKSAEKRLKLTARHKLKRNRANAVHNNEKKGSARKRLIATSATVSGKLARNLRRALGAKVK